MARGMYFRKLKLEEYTAPSSFELLPVSARDFALFTQQDVGQFSSLATCQPKKNAEQSFTVWELAP